VSLCFRGEFPTRPDPDSYSPLDATPAVFPQPGGELEPTQVFFTVTSMAVHHVLDDYYLAITLLVTVGYQLVGFAIAYTCQFDKLTGKTTFRLIVPRAQKERGNWTEPQNVD
jgi:hypothetical protein